MRILPDKPISVSPRLVVLKLFEPLVVKVVVVNTPKRFMWVQEFSQLWIIRGNTVHKFPLLLSTTASLGVPKITLGCDISLERLTEFTESSYTHDYSLLQEYRLKSSYWRVQRAESRKNITPWPSTVFSPWGQDASPSWHVWQHAQSATYQVGSLRCQCSASLLGLY